MSVPNDNLASRLPGGRRIITMVAATALLTSATVGIATATGSASTAPRTEVSRGQVVAFQEAGDVGGGVLGGCFENANALDLGEPSGVQCFDPQAVAHRP